MKRYAVTALKILFSITLIGYLFATKVDLIEVLKSLVNIDAVWLLAAASLHVSGLFFSAVRWKILLRAQGIDQKIWRLFAYYLVGHFFNMFLPTQVGGDLIRIYDTSKDHGSTAQPFAVILVERVSGLLTLLLIASIVVLIRIDIGFDVYGKFPNLEYAIFAFIIVLCLLPLLFHPKIEKYFMFITGKIKPLSKLAPVAQKFFKAFQVYGGKSRYLIGAVGVGMFLQVNYMLHFYFIARALHFDIGPAFFFVIIPIRCVVLMIPFFINGIGLREFFDVTVYSLVNIPQNSAVAFSELAWLVQIGFALIGAAVYVLRKRRPDRRNA